MCNCKEVNVDNQGHIFRVQRMIVRRMRYF